jgi:hypothetical protein
MDVTKEDYNEGVTGLLSELRRIGSGVQDLSKALGGDRPNQTKAPIAPAQDKTKIDFFDVDNAHNKSNIGKFAAILGTHFSKYQKAPSSEEGGKTSDQIPDILDKQNDYFKNQIRSSDVTNNALAGLNLKQADSLDAEKSLAQEKTVVKAPQKMILTDLDTKATKKFSGFFGGLKGLFGGKSKPDPGKEKKAESGFWSMLGGALLLGTGALISGTINLAKGIIKGVGAVAEGAWAGIKAGYHWVGKKLNQGWGWLKGKLPGWKQSVAKGWSSFTTTVSGFFTSAGEKIKDGWKYLKGSKIGQAAVTLGKNATGFWSALSMGVSTAAGKVTGLFKSKPVVAKTTGVALSALAANSADDITKAAGKGVTGATKAATKGFGKAALKGVARLAGPIAMAGFAVFDGATAAWDEYEKSGSLLAAAKEGLAGAASGLTFGLISQETISGAMNAVGDTISGGINLIAESADKLLTDPVGTILAAGRSISDSAKGLLDTATSWLFGSPHATHYLNKASDKIHDGTVDIANASSNLGDSSSGFFDKVGAGIKDYYIWAGDMGSTIGGGIKDYYSKAFAHVGSVMGSAWSGIKGLFSSNDPEEAIKKQANLAEDLTGSVVDTVNRRGEDMRVSVRNMLDEVILLMNEQSNVIHDERVGGGSTSTTNNSRAANKQRRDDKQNMTGGLGNSYEWSGANYDEQSGGVAVKERDGSSIMRVKTSPRPTSSKPITPQYDHDMRIKSSPSPTSLQAPQSPQSSPTENPDMMEKLEQLVTAAHSQVKLLQASNSQATKTTETLIEAMSKENNTIVTNNSSNTSVVNTASGITNHRGRLMTN